MKQTKRIIALLLTTMLVAGAVMMNGCSLQKKPSRVDTAKAALQAKYGEEFNVRIDESYSEVFYATCSPVNNPEVLFEARFSDSTGVTNINQDDYYERYTASLINEILEKDLQKFFPGAYFRIFIDFYPKQEFTDISNHSLEELIGNADEDKVQAFSVDIYVDEAVGTTKQYEEEYLYFTETVDRYIQEKKMFPIMITITKVDGEKLNYIKEYFKTEATEKSNFNDGIGIQVGSERIIHPEDTDPGNPPCIVANFSGKGIVIENVEEYIRRREIWENAK